MAACIKDKMWQIWNEMNWNHITISNCSQIRCFRFFLFVSCEHKYVSAIAMPHTFRRPEILEFEIVSFFSLWYNEMWNVKCVTNHLLCAHFLFCFVRSHSLISVYSNWNPFVPISSAQNYNNGNNKHNPQHIECQLELISIIFFFHHNELAWFQFHALLFFSFSRHAYPFSRRHNRNLVNWWLSFLSWFISVLAHDFDTVFSGFGCCIHARVNRIAILRRTHCVSNILWLLCDLPPLSLLLQLFIEFWWITTLQLLNHISGCDTSSRTR